MFSGVSFISSIFCSFNLPSSSASTYYTPGAGHIPHILPLFVYSFPSSQLSRIKSRNDLHKIGLVGFAPYELSIWISSRDP
jgi:hypothetical protein